MNRSQLLLLLVPVALLAALGIYMLGDRGDGGALVDENNTVLQEEVSQGTEADTGAQPSKEISLAKAERQVLEASFTEDREAPEYERALSGITGRIVMDEDGAPVADLPVVLVEVDFAGIAPSLDGLAGLTERRKPVFIRGRTKTDAEGRFRFRRMHSRAFHALSIGPGTDKVTFRLLPHGIPVGGDKDMGEIRLATRGSIEGKLVDEAGQAVAGATVRAMDIPQLVAGFGIANVNPKATVLVREGDVTVIFDFPAWVQELEKDLPFPVARSRADGSFRLDGVTPGQQTLLVLPERGLSLSKPTRVRANKVSRFRKIKIKSGEVLAGLCVDRSGKPVQEVELRSGERLGPSPFTFLGPIVQSDAKGAFRIAGAGRRANHVVYRRESTSPWIYAGEFRPGDPIRIEMPSLGSGRVEVKDTLGKPVTEVEFQLSLASELASIPGFERPVQLEGHLEPIEGVPGSWRIKDLEEGEYRLVARSDGHAVVTGLLSITKAAEGRVALVMPEAPVYRFEVVNENRRPVAGARIYWDVGRSRRQTRTQAPRRARLSEPAVLLGKTNSEGVLEVKNVEKGASSFSARHPAYALGSSQKDVLGEKDSYVFVLTQAAKVLGKVHDSNSKGKEQERHMVMAEPTWQLRRAYGDSMLPRFVATDAEGQFELDGLTPGAWRFQVLPDFFGASKISDFFTLAMKAEASHSERKEVALAAGIETRVDLQVGPKEQYHGPGIIEGIVTINGRPRKGLAISARSDKGSHQAETTELGRFRIEGLPQSDIRVRITMGDFRNLERSQIWSGRIDLKKQTTFQLLLDLQTTTAVIQLFDPNGMELPGVGVYLTRPHAVAGTQGGDTRYRGLSDGDGIVRIEEVALGTYSLAFDWSSRRRGIVLPVTQVDIRQGGVPIRITGEKALEASGRIEWVTSHLDPEEKRAFDLKMAKIPLDNDQPWLNLGGDWGTTQMKDGHWTFHLNCLSRGQHKAQCWYRSITWTSDPLEMQQDRQGIVLQMKPDPNRVRQWVRALAQAEGRAKPKPEPGKKTKNQ